LEKCAKINGESITKIPKFFIKKIGDFPYYSHIVIRQLCDAHFIKKESLFSQKQINTLSQNGQIIKYSIPHLTHSLRNANK